MNISVAGVFLLTAIILLSVLVSPWFALILLGLALFS